MNTRKLDLNLLVALEALLAERNVTRAAKRLNLSQPALSAQLARMRVVFGDELLVPSPRGVLPTAMAEELEGPLRQALDHVRAVLRSTQGFDPRDSDATFSITSSDYMQLAVLLPFLLRIHASAPGIRVMVKLVHDAGMVRAELERGDLDVAFLQSEDLAGTGLRCADVLTERYVGIVRKGVPPPTTRAAFSGGRHIIVSPRSEGFRGPTDEALAAVGLERRVAFAVSSFMLLIEAVAGCDLVAMAPERLVHRFLDRLDVFEPPVQVPGFTIAMVWHHRTNDHPARAWLRRELAGFCEGL